MFDKVVELEQELLKFKTTQQTAIDSTKLYTQTFDFGYYEVVTMGNVYARDWTLKCIPEVNAENAIFSPIMPGKRSINIQTVGVDPNGRYLTASPDIITFRQSVYTTEDLSQNRRHLVAHSITVYSNVPFHIETSYVDLTM